MNRWVVWTGVLALLGGAGFGGYRLYKVGTTAQASYRTGPVRHTDITQTITATGTIVPEDVVDVGAQVNGQIATFGTDKDGKPVDYRSTVEEGALLARIDDSLYAADVASSEARLGQAQAQVGVAIANRESARAKLEQGRRDWERAQKLGNTAALARAEYDAAQSGFEQATAAVAVAEATITQAKAAVAQEEATLIRARRNVTFCVINSPVSGVIIDKRVEIGQTVVASLNAPSLFLIAKDLKRMQVLVQVNEADIGNVTPGQKVRFTTDAFPGRPFKGEVRMVRLNATMTQNVVTYTVEIATENADLTLLPYLTANVRFEVAKHDNVLAVPNAALRWSPRAATPDSTAGPAPGPTAAPATGGGGPARQGRRSGGDGADRAGTVWVLKEGQPQSIQVKTGISDGSMTEVTGEGLAEGMEVVLGEQSTTSGQPAATGATNPFAPPVMRGGGGRGR